MKITVVWDNTEQTLIRFDFNGRWSFDDFFEATRTAHGMIEARTHQKPVATLLNFNKYPVTTGNLISFAQRGIAHKHAQTAVVILVTENSFIEAIRKTLVKVYPTVGSSFLQANTLDQGRIVALQHLANLQTG